MTSRMRGGRLPSSAAGAYCPVPAYAAASGGNGPTTSRCRRDRSEQRRHLRARAVECRARGIEDLLLRREVERAVAREMRAQLVERLHAPQPPADLEHLAIDPRRLVEAELVQLGRVEVEPGLSADRRPVARRAVGQARQPLDVAAVRQHLARHQIPQPLVRGLDLLLDLRVDVGDQLVADLGRKLRGTRRARVRPLGRRLREGRGAARRTAAPSRGPRPCRMSRRRACAHRSDRGSRGPRARAPGRRRPVLRS